jgi:hypothetical protein
MTQYLAIDKDSRVLYGLGRPDPEDFSGPPSPLPEAEDGLAYVAWQVPLMLSAAPTPTSELRWDGNAPMWVETGSLDDVKAHKLAELAGVFSAQMAAVKAGYPDEEVLSWAEQKAEALAYTADPTATVPLLTSMAAARGITVDDLAARVLAKAHGWAVMSGALIGKRQAYEDAVGAAAGIEEVRAIVWQA